MILEHEAFCFCDDLVLLAKEMKRLLKPDGVIVRVVKYSSDSPPIEEVNECASKIISRRYSHGILFVGENVDHFLDTEFSALGLVSTTFGPLLRDETVCIREQISSIDKQAFPYLNSLSPDEISSLCDYLHQEYEPKLDCEELRRWDYYFVVSSYPQMQPAICNYFGETPLTKGKLPWT